MKRLVRGVLRAAGFDIVRYRPPIPLADVPADCSAHERATIEAIAGYTMTGVESQITLIRAVRHLVRNRIEGCLVECGVWRGGSSMAMALTLVQEGDTTRDLHLFDTFAGMTLPQDVDRTTDGTSAQQYLDRDPGKAGGVWAVTGLAEVRRNMQSTAYPQARMHHVQGPVETTLPLHAPAGPIALLRLDTDWYASTRHELMHLFPRLCDGGILLIDDYGHWEGARRAVDEYFAGYGRAFYLHRVDYTGRLLVKHAPE